MWGEWREVGRLTHGDAQQTDAGLYAANDDEQVARVAAGEPVIRLEREGKGEDVFEDEKTGECLDGNVAMGVDDVERAVDD